MPLVFSQKYNQAGIKLYKTPRDGAEHRKGEAEAEGTGVRRTRRDHSVPEGDWTAGRVRQGGGVRVRLTEAGRGRKGTQ